jgi:simple sugar transport system permease protein
VTRDGRRPGGVLKRALDHQDLLLAVVAVVLMVVVVVIAPNFLHVETLFNIARSSMVSLIFAVGVLVVLIAGGIDVSFLAVGIFAAYVTCKVVPAEGPLEAVVLPLGLSILIGIGLGLVNAAVVLGARVSSLIATLATSAIFLGVLFAFVGGVVINRIPEPLAKLGQLSLLVLPGAQRGSTRLSVIVLAVIVVCLIVAGFLRWTMAGRWVYAIGGDAEAARRTGIPVRGTTVLVFALAGGLAGFAGIIHVSLSGRADPTTFFGGELDVLAAVVLGGAAITGGRGSVRGTLIGVLVIAVINASLIPLGVPSIWQKAVVGLLLIVGVVLQAVSARVRPLRLILHPDDPAMTPARAHPIRNLTP